MNSGYYDTDVATLSVTYERYSRFTNSHPIDMYHQLCRIMSINFHNAEKRLIIVGDDVIEDLSKTGMMYR